MRRSARWQLPWLLGLASAASLACGAPSPTANAESSEASSACAPRPDAAPGGLIDAATSAALVAAGPSLEENLEGAANAARGVRRWNREGGGAAGAVYATQSYRLGPEACVDELVQMARLTLAGGPDAESFQGRARPLQADEPAEIEAAFAAWVRSGPEEEAAVAALARQLAGFGTEHPDLLLFGVDGEAVKIRHAGIALVDPRTREALWVYGRAVQGSAHRRDGKPVLP